MRALLVAIGLSMFVTVVASTPTSARPAMTQPTIAAVQTVQTPGKDVNIDINVNRTGGGYWYRNPLWIGIGALAVIIVLLVVVLAARGGGGTTIIKE